MNSSVKIPLADLENAERTPTGSPSMVIGAWAKDLIPSRWMIWAEKGFSMKSVSLITVTELVRKAAADIGVQARFPFRFAQMFGAHPFLAADGQGILSVRRECG